VESYFQETLERIRRDMQEELSRDLKSAISIEVQKVETRFSQQDVRMSRLYRGYGVRNIEEERPSTNKQKKLANRRRRIPTASSTSTHRQAHQVLASSRSARPDRADLVQKTGHQFDYPVLKEEQLNVLYVVAADSFQGREAGTVILSLVSTANPGFARDKRRVNVALTRLLHSAYEKDYEYSEERKSRLHRTRENSPANIKQASLLWKI